MSEQTDKLAEIRDFMKKGKSKNVVALVQEALDMGIPAQEILDDSLLMAMNEIGVVFKAGEVFVPEVLVAARAMNKGIELLKPHLASQDDSSKGVAVLGTVKGDLHDIGKNLVKIMVEGRGIKVVDIGVDVTPEAFAEAAKEYNTDLVMCSALLTTTMGEMKNVLAALEEQGLRDKVKVMIGGAPITQAYCDEIGADAYSEDAASAAEAAERLIQEMHAK